MTSAPQLELSSSRQLSDWLAEQQLSLAFTTYQAGKLFFVGLQADGRLSIFERTFNRCLGLWSNGQTIWMSSLYQLWRFENTLADGQTAQGYDRLYVPRVGYVTGDLDVHDLAVEAGGRIVFVNTLFSCLATISETHSFTPLWQPAFISKLAAEDRCHMNGVATRDGQVRYVTCVSQSDAPDGWRDHRRDGGCVIDVKDNNVVAEKISMPHSPRWYDERLWLLDESGSGHFGQVDLSTGRFEPVAFCPGYLRGLSFLGQFAVVGVSQSRENRAFSGLALDDNLKTKRADARCGIYVIDLKTGDVVHWLRIEGVVRELYDVVVLPGAKRPMALGFKTDEIRRTISIGEAAD